MLRADKVTCPLKAMFTSASQEKNSHLYRHSLFPTNVAVMARVVVLTHQRRCRDLAKQEFMPNNLYWCKI